MIACFLRGCKLASLVSDWRRGGANPGSAITLRTVALLGPAGVVVLAQVFDADGEIRHEFSLWDRGESHPDLHEMLILR